MLACNVENFTLLALHAHTSNRLVPQVTTVCEDYSHSLLSNPYYGT